MSLDIMIEPTPKRIERCSPELYEVIEPHLGDFDIRYCYLELTAEVMGHLRRLSAQGDKGAQALLEAGRTDALSLEDEGDCEAVEIMLG